MHAEKKIRVLNLMQMGLVAAAISAPEALHSVDGTADVCDISWLSDQISVPHDFDFCLTEVEENLVYYTSGCTGRSVSRV